MLAGGLLITAAWFYYRFDPARTAWMPQCLFHRLTGWECPACGSQRAIYSLLHGRVGAAFRFNPFMIISIPYLAAVAWTTFDRRPCAVRWRGRVQHPKVVRLYFVAVVGWWIGRNLF
ncbi:MAG: DUF2752 domain-containing protein [Alistipes senegalensis]|nr:DUF2752 domain-containing protein [Bacteroides cellulosilyticus]MCM1352165.1 DUF2752 domain-containing protein [Alistipes senegalensis]